MLASVCITLGNGTIECGYYRIGFQTFIRFHSHQGFAFANRITNTFFNFPNNAVEACRYRLYTLCVGGDDAIYWQNIADGARGNGCQRNAGMFYLLLGQLDVAFFTVLFLFSVTRLGESLSRQQGDRKATRN